MGVDRQSVTFAASFEIRTSRTGQKDSFGKARLPCWLPCQLPSTGLLVPRIVVGDHCLCHPPSEPIIDAAIHKIRSPSRALVDQLIMWLGAGKRAGAIGQGGFVRLFEDQAPARAPSLPPKPRTFIGSSFFGRHRMLVTKRNVPLCGRPSKRGCLRSVSRESSPAGDLR